MPDQKAESREKRQKPRKEYFGLELPVELIYRLHRVAVLRDLPVRVVAREALTKGLDAMEAPRA